jgi:hypothetical protein
MKSLIKIFEILNQKLKFQSFNHYNYHQTCNNRHLGTVFIDLRIDNFYLIVLSIKGFSSIQLLKRIFL